MTIDRNGTRLSIIHDEYGTAPLECDDLEAGIKEACNCLARCVYYGKDEAPTSLRQYNSAKVIYDLCKQPKLILDAERDNGVQPVHLLRLCFILEEALRRQHLLPADKLAMLHWVALKLQLEEAGDAKKTGNDSDFQPHCINRAREFVSEAAEHVTRLKDDKQKCLEEKVEKLCEKAMTVSCLEKDRSLAALFIEKWALIARMDVFSAQRLEILSAQKSLKVLLTVSRYFIWPIAALLLLICIAMFTWATPIISWAGNAVVFGFTTVLAAAFLLCIIAWPQAGRAWATRMGAVSLLGYVVLVSTPQAANLSTSLYWWHQWGISVLAMVLCGLYLFFGETVKRVTNMRTAFIRTIGLLVLGLAQSWAIGAVGYTLLIREYPQTPEVPIFWIWGPIALLIGLIVQSLWEKDAITEPI